MRRVHGIIAPSGFTIATLIKAALALVLSKLSSSSDVTMLQLTSGRRGGHDGMDEQRNRSLYKSHASPSLFPKKIGQGRISANTFSVKMLKAWHMRIQILGGSFAIAPTGP